LISRAGVVSWNASPSSVRLCPEPKRYARTGGRTHAGREAGHGSTTSIGGIMPKPKRASPTAPAASAVGDAHTSCVSVTPTAAVCTAATSELPLCIAPNAHVAAAVPRKPEPKTVTLVPPSTEPLAGEMDVTLGGS
jgi:hypothetical protein